eukprot:TRINITY_DN20813_c0_g1_i1.p1 TRINITY_DN20813_c0_g1~~TRINITY_DN20813_c0_g1_i1.p1  ORF type:complete len:372 (-),score=76.10 TRINITY_DN20813_c0_g1_i1:209-1324(-)
MSSASEVSGMLKAKSEKPTEDKPILVVIDKKWSFDVFRHCWNPETGRVMPVDPEHFLTEAKVEDLHVKTLRTRFKHFATSAQDSDPSSGVVYLTFEGFHKLNAQYEVCCTNDEAHFFRAMDRDRRYRLSFEDFLLGCTAASPVSPHILNSYTGYARARYIFDFYNASQTGHLDWEELTRLLLDSRLHVDDDVDARRKYAVETAMEHGDVDVVTLRLHARQGHVLDIRVSKMWTGLRIRREVALFVDVPVEAQQLFIGVLPIAFDTVLDEVLPQGASCIDMAIVLGDPEMWPPIPPACPVETAPGLERFVHLSFEKFYKALFSERLRGTSRLFRMQKSLLLRPKTTSRSGRPSGGQMKLSQDAAPPGAVGGA